MLNFVFFQVGASPPFQLVAQLWPWAERLPPSPSPPSSIGSIVPPPLTQQTISTPPHPPPSPNLPRWCQALPPRRNSLEIKIFHVLLLNSVAIFPNFSALGVPNLSKLTQATRQGQVTKLGHVKTTQKSVALVTLPIHLLWVFDLIRVVQDISVSFARVLKWLMDLALKQMCLPFFREAFLYQNKWFVHT